MQKQKLTKESKSKADSDRTRYLDRTSQESSGVVQVLTRHAEKGTGKV